MDNQQAQPSSTSTTSAVTTDTSYVDTYAPPRQDAPAPAVPTEPEVATSPVTPTQPITQAAPVTPTTPPGDGKVSQTLEDQNIFHLLGIEDASDEEKESFLDELQQIIWEDFLEHDVELLVTEEEMTDFKKIAEKQGISEEQRQTEMIEFLEKLIPDLEKIMLEKALELKEEMVRERVAELKDTYQSQPDKAAKVQQVHDLIEDQQWRDAADLMNSLAAK